MVKDELNEQLENYEAAKQEIYQKKTSTPKTRMDFGDFDAELLEPARGVEVADILQAGTKIVIGGGLGLMAGIATIAVAASAAEVVVAGVVTKIAGVVGGAVGLSWGVSSIKKKKDKRYSYL
ncbi:MAG: hypothetical protein HQK77_08060 [Desulfobacterales bacterium]|nr:hypothetical protein [Desulfobacterales bacterium]